MHYLLRFICCTLAVGAPRSIPLPACHPHAHVSFSPNVEFWRPQILRYVPSPAGGVDFWLAWAAKESGGNPCGYTSLRESGIFQLMPPDNTAQGGTTEAALRAACSGQSLARSLTEADIREQVVSFDRYLAYIIAYAKAKLAAAGANWPESSPDFWKMVKFVHVAPARIAPWLAAATAGLGHPPRSWAELVPYAGAANVPANWVANADEVGSHGRSNATIIMAAAVVVGAGVLYYLWKKRGRR